MSCQSDLNQNKKKYLVKTLGCKANLFDSQQMENQLEQQGFSATDGDQVDLCIVNSCSVTNEADKQSIKMAKKLSKQHPNAKIVFTGCSAEVDPELALKKDYGIDYVISNRDKYSLAGQASDLIIKNKQYKPVLLGDTRSYEQMVSRHPIDREWPATEPIFDQKKSFDVSKVIGSSQRTRAFLKIQEGCNAFCTYCIIPYGRGPSRSLRPNEVVTQVQKLVDSGVQEIVVTGTNIGHYGFEWEPKLSIAFIELLDLILSKTKLKRLRLSSLDPAETSQELIDFMNTQDKLCPHFHLSLQSPHSKILKLMKRKYDFNEVQKCFERMQKVKAPVGGVFIGMDLITGFPGESEEIYQWSVEALKQLDWTRMHVFPYSERKSTPATKLPGVVYPHIRKERSKELSKLSLQRLKSHYQSVLDQSCDLEDVLLESKTKGPDGSDCWISGLTKNYLRVHLKINDQEQLKSLENTIVRVKPQSLVIDQSASEVAFLSTLQ